MIKLIINMEYPDIVLYICEYLSDNSVIKFLSCSSKTYLLIKKIFFKEFYKLSKVEHLSCYNNLTSIIADKQILVLPINIKNFDIVEIYLNEHICDLPISLEYLKLPNIPIRTSIFSTNLKLKTIHTYSSHFYNFHEKVPKSVTKLILYGSNFLEANYIPKHITHLEIMFHSENLYCYKVPDTITHLKTHSIIDANFVKRDMTLVVPIINKDQIESIEHHPNFKVIYFE